MKSYSPFLVLASTLFIAASSHAESDYITAGSRPLSDQVQEKMYADRQAEWEESVDGFDETLSVLLIPIKGYQYASLASSDSTQSEFSLFRFHWIDHFMTQENAFSLEDGSEWGFDKGDAQVLLSWKPFDPIEITPRQPLPWGSAYEYVVTNKNQNTSIYANLIGIPRRSGSNTSWVHALQRHSLTLKLLNGDGTMSSWEVAPSDADIFQEWKHDDSVIVGYNNSWLWWFSTYDHILINVNLKTFVRAKLSPAD